MLMSLAKQDTKSQTKNTFDLIKNKNFLCHKGHDKLIRTHW